MNQREGTGLGRRSHTLLDQMSAIDHGTDSLAGLTLDAVLAAEKRQPSSAVAPTRTQVNRTLLDIIRDDEPHGSLFGHKDKKTWKAFRDRLRLRRASAAWTSSIHIPPSDIPIQNSNRLHYHHTSGTFSDSNSNSSSNQGSLVSRRNSVRFTTVSTLNSGESTQLADMGDNQPPALSVLRPMMTRRSSTRLAIPAPASSELDDSASAAPNILATGDMPTARSFRPQMSRHNSPRFPAAGSNPVDGEAEVRAHDGTRQLAVALAEERALSAREAVAAQEAARQAAAEEEDDEDLGEDTGGAGPWGEGQPVRMSLMDLLEETDRQTGFVGSRYSLGEDDVEGEGDDREEDDDKEEVGGNSGVEHTCCVCMVRHKGAAFIPCGHTFCRMCSRELWVQRGYCPLCNGCILEILDIF